MSEKYLLSILIPTIIGREEQCHKLLGKLNKQLKDAKIETEVELLIQCDNRQMSIGSKRQLLVNNANGEYIVFIDDDDDIPIDYCTTILDELKRNKDIDCIGFLQSCTFNNSEPVIASLSNRWDDWGEHVGGYRYVRTPFFPTPIRREIVRQVGYSDLRFGEDHDFARRLKSAGLIKKEVFLEKIMYYYQYIYVPHHIKYGQP